MDWSANALRRNAQPPQLSSRFQPARNVRKSGVESIDDLASPDGGAVVTSSVVGSKGFSANTVYAATKAAAARYWSA